MKTFPLSNLSSGRETFASHCWAHLAVVIVVNNFCKKKKLYNHCKEINKIK